MRIRSLRSLLLIVLMSSSVFAQRTTPSPGRGLPGSGSTSNNSGLSGNTEIQVRISWANQRPVDDIIHIQLINQSGVPVAEAFTTHEGMAEFRNQKFGTYQLRLDGANIADLTTERFQIVPGESMHMEWVHVKPRESNRAATSNSEGQVSVAEMNTPDKARKEMERGMDYFGKNDFKEADKHLEKAIELYPRYARAWNNLGVIKAKDGDRAGAAVAWQKAIEADDKFSSAYFNLARIDLANNQPAEAQKLIEKGLSGNPSDVEGLFLLVNAQAMQGNWEQAIINARKVHTGEHKRFAEVHIIAAQGLAAQNQPKLAIAEYEMYLEEFPDSPRASQIRQNMAQLQAKVQ